MARLHTNHICTITELREPQKVLDRAGGKPVAILKNSKCVGYIVPAEGTMEGEPRHASLDEVRNYVSTTRAKTQPILDYLKDK